jgi:hypothetical protein
MRRRESRYSERKGKKPDQHSGKIRYSNDENKENWTTVGSNNKQNKRKDDMAQDGMTSYHIKKG